MRVLVVSGIWPPDVGGPASHAPEVARFLSGHGHDVTALVTADAEPATEPYPVRWVTRRLPVGVRHAETVRLVAAAARRSQVVYTTGMFGRSALGSTLARRPFVVKLTGDPAYERARRRGLFRGSLADFQRAAPPSTLPLRAVRDAGLRRAAHVVCPSAFLRELALGWGLEPDRVSVLPNPAPTVGGLPPREALRERFGFAGPTLVFAGRLTTQKSLHVAIEAARRAGGVELVIAGDGPDREALERLGGARFLGAAPRDTVLELFRAADAAVLTSSWENFPHTVVEALAVGTPVLATRTGGVGEVVEDGVNGLVVEPNDVDAFAGAIRRYLDDDGLRLRLAAAAASSVERYAPERVYAELEGILERVRLH